MAKIQLALFDLDGVLVDTAEFHYLAWKKLAARFGYDLTREENEQFKGVSRDRCMQLLCGFMQREMSPEEQRRWSAWKNGQYVESISSLDCSALLPGSLDLLERLKRRGVRTALGSASKNAGLILQRLGIEQAFDCVVDGTKVQRAKPDPQVFLLSAQMLHIEPCRCAVFEDSAAGVEAAHRAEMKAVGVGSPKILSSADLIVKDLSEMNDDQLDFLDTL